MSRNVPLASFLCNGTTVLYVPSVVIFCSDIWLPFCLTTTNPASSNAFTSSFPDKTGSLDMSNFHYSQVRFRNLLRKVFSSKAIDVPVSYTHLRAHETDSYLV